MLEKAAAEDFPGRFREIISDPLNLMIRRVPNAGVVSDGMVCLHNGIHVPLNGSGSYYGDFSQILAINRGVHEPLEEYVFQQMAEVAPAAPVMLELGAYWGHYSMWMKRVRPGASVYLVEPELENIEAGRANFLRNGIEGNFTQAFVGREHFRVDQFLCEHKVEHLDILHSDIQGYEMEMLECCTDLLAEARIGYVFVSTHSQDLHRDTLELLGRFNYRVEAASDFDFETTSFDGFVFATAPTVAPVLGKNFRPLARTDIVHADPRDLIGYLARISSPD